MANYSARPSDTTWTTWATTDSTSAATGDGSVWVAWSTESATGGSSNIYTYPARELTPEEIEVQRVANEERQREQAERDRRRTEARQRATELLMAHLDEQQLREFEANGQFALRLNEREYRVVNRRSNMVEEYEGGRKVRMHCAVLPEECPTEDQMLLVKLMLESDDPVFREVAITRNV